MCKLGTSIDVAVRAVDDRGQSYRKVVGIDACIAPLIRALQAAGIDTVASCCGHGKTLGRIDLADGRVLFIGHDTRVEGRRH